MHQFRQIEGNLFLGPQPTDEDLKQARQKGVRTVIDFRMPGETPTENRSLAQRHGLDYVNIPVDKTCLSEAQVDALEQAMTDKQGPFLIHCASGARAAMLLALSKARKQHWSTERTFEEAAAMGFDVRGSPELSAFVRSVTAR